MAYPDGVVPTLEKVHPAPVYETLSHLGIAALLWSVRTRIQTPGASFAIYLILAGVARFAVESIRINPRVLWGYSEAQLISIVFVLGGLFLAVRLRLKGKE